MNVPRKSLFGKLNTSLFRAMESATAYAKLKSHTYVELEHWLWHLWQIDASDIKLLAAHYKLDFGQIEIELRGASEQRPASARGLIDFGDELLQLTEQAWVYASLCQRDQKIRSAWLIGAAQTSTVMRKALRAASPTLAKMLITDQQEDLNNILQHSIEGHEQAYEQSGLNESVPGEASDAMHHNADASDALSKYCQDLTEQAFAGKLDPVIGRDREIQTMIDILLRRRQNNPILTGEAGVGKTAVVEGLAQAIANKQTPPALENIRLLALDVGALIAGASMRGEFESRLKNLLKQAQESERPVILFIDEIHTLVGAGGQAGTGDAANLLKPALARGGLRTIGATTWGEYKKYIEKDPALTRRFQVLQVKEPDINAAKTMLRALVANFSQYHGVLITQEGVDAAVELSQRYITDRQLPDKAISLLDTACARVSMSLHAEPQALIEIRQRKINLNTQLSHIEQEKIRHPKKETKFQQLQDELREVEEQLTQCEDRWLKEKELVNSLINHWNQAANQNEPEKRVAWGHIEEELKEIQKENAFVNPEVNAEIVASIVSSWTGIPAGRMLADEKRTILGLEALLTKRIKGQGNALKAISEQVQIAKAGLGNPEKPIGVFLMVGPSGVGKTETALALAQAIYGGERNLITINMSEFQESHTVSSLKGAPPGYVGYGEGGLLTEAVRRRPYSVILLDEVEKAHPDVHEIFYQVFDKGSMEDGEGRPIDFRNTLILLTSNTGSEVIEQYCSDDALIPSIDVLTEALQPELRKVFPAAFLGRVLVTPYLPLSQKVIAEITSMQLEKVIQRVLDKYQVQLTFAESAVQQVQKAGGAIEIGGRRIAQHIERNILPILSLYWLEKPFNDMQSQRLLLNWSSPQGYWLEEANEPINQPIEHLCVIEK